MISSSSTGSRRAKPPTSSKRKCLWRWKVPDKQLSIPGLEPSPLFLTMSYNPRPKPAGWSVDRVRFLEKRISSLELELAILKIQMEKNYA